jgi:hypothetical protein
MLKSVVVAGAGARSTDGARCTGWLCSMLRKTAPGSRSGVWATALTQQTDAMAKTNRRVVKAAGNVMRGT